MFSRVTDAAIITPWEGAVIQVGDPWASGSGVSVTISPTSVPLSPGGTEQFTATVTGNSNTAVTWSATGGSISGTGNTITYTAPDNPGSYKVTATSKADTSKSASATVTVSSSTTCTDPNQVVNIPDANLKTVIENQLGISGSPTCAQMQRLPQLTAHDDGIQNLEGLEYAINLTFLDLSHNRINNLGPLTHLTNLTELELGDNQIGDISPLATANLPHLTLLWLGGNQISDLNSLATANLPNLTDLELGYNQISDISPLAKLTSLTQLLLKWNRISDLSPLANLTNLTGLFLRNNQISDLVPLANLTHLTDLELGYNQIGDIQPLVDNSGLGSGDVVFIENNRLNLNSGSQDRNDIDTLQERGVEVIWK